MTALPEMVNQQEKQMATRKRKQVNEVHHKADEKKDEKKKDMEKDEKKSMKKESTDKFQQMLEYLVNEDSEKAEEIFHEIVVEKSRQIYEELLAEELAEDSDEEVEEGDDEEVEESDDEEVEESEEEEVEENDEDLEEDFDLDEFDVEEAPMGGDPSDDMEMDMDDQEGDMDMEMDMDDQEGDMDMDGDAPATQDDIKDLEAELADLKAEFEELMSDKDMDDDDMDMGSDEGDDDMDMDDEGEMDKESYDEFEEASDEEVEEADDEEVDENNLPLSAAEQMREYVEKVSASMGDNGAYTKSPIASKNDMGGDASNLVQGGEADTKGTTGGLAAPSTKEENMGNVNVPGGKASKSMKAMPKGHGAEKKGAGDTAPNKKSTIGS